MWCVFELLISVRYFIRKMLIDYFGKKLTAVSCDV